jgi:ribosomal protein L32
MKKIWWWIIGIVVLVLIGSLVLAGFGFMRFARSPMVSIGDRFHPFDRFDGYRFPSGMRMNRTIGLPFVGILGGLLMFALPVGIIALIVVGVILLVRSSKKSKTVESATAPLVCSECGEEVLPNWKVCPHCGHVLKDEQDEES